MTGPEPTGPLGVGMAGHRGSCVGRRWGLWGRREGLSEEPRPGAPTPRRGCLGLGWAGVVGSVHSGSLPQKMGSN